MTYASNSNKNNLDILIKATDQASNVLKGIGSNILNLGGLLNSTNLLFAGLGISAIKSFQSVGSAVANTVSFLSNLYNSVKLVKGTIEQPIIKGFIDSIANDAIAATQSTQKLSDIIKATTGLASSSGSFMAGLFAIPESESLESRTRKAFQGAFDSARKGLIDNISGSNKLLNTFLNKNLGNIGEKVSDIFKTQIFNPNNLKFIQPLLSRTFDLKNLFKGGFSFKEFFSSTGGISKFLIGTFSDKNLFRGFQNTLIGSLSSGFAAGVQRLSRGIDNVFAVREAPFVPIPSPTSRSIVSKFFNSVLDDFSAKAGKGITKNVGSALINALTDEQVLGKLNFFERQFAKIFKLGAGRTTQFSAEQLGKLAIKNVVGGLVNSLIPNIPIPSFAEKYLDKFLESKSIEQWADLGVSKLRKAINKVASTPTEVLASSLNTKLIAGIRALGTALPKEITEGFTKPFAMAARAMSFIGSEVAGNLTATFASTLTGGVANFGGIFASVVAGAIRGEDAATVIRNQAKFIKDAITFVINTVKAAINAGKGIINFASFFINNFQKVDAALDGLLSEVGRKIGTKLLAAFANALVGTPVRNAFQRAIIEPILKGFDFVDTAFTSIVTKIKTIPQQFADFTGNLAKPFAYVAGFNEPLEVFNELQGLFGGFAEGVGAVSQQIFFFQSVLQSAQQLVMNGPYALLIGQNIELRKQLLETQASIVATNKISIGGKQIIDPTAAIIALDAPVQAAIDKIRKGSLELVGVTSKDLVGVFNIVASQAALVGINLEQASKLTLDFSAAFGTIGLPLSQARQEIQSIFQGNIDNNSALAKNLNLTNDVVRKLIQQGKLYDFLTDKLKAFRAGNALAAQTIEGVSSNIQEIFELSFLKAGEKLLQPIVDNLNKFYEFLAQNQGQVENYISGIVDNLIITGNAVAKIIQSIAGGIGDVALAIPQYLFKELAAGAVALADAVSFSMDAFRPFFALLAELAKFVIANLSGIPAKAAISLMVLSTTVNILSKSFGIMMNLLPGVGQLLFYFTTRMGPLINQFAFLSKELKNANLAFGLLAAQNLRAIPGAFDLVASKIPVFGATIAALVPQMATFAIGLVGLNANFPKVGKVIQEVTGVIGTGLLPAIAEAAKSRGLTELGESIGKAGDKVGDLAKRTDILTLAQEKLSGFQKELGASLRNQVLKFVGYGAAIAAAALILSEFFQRQSDAGDGIRKLSKDTQAATQLIKSTYKSLKGEIEKPLDITAKTPSLDWMDELITKTRELEKGTLEVNNFFDSLYAFGAVLAKVIQVGVVIPIQTTSRILGAFIFGAIEAAKQVASNPLDLKNVQAAAQRYKSLFDDAFKETAVSFEQGFSGIETKAEEQIREIAAAVSSGEFASAVNQQVQAVKELTTQGVTAGKLFNKPISEVQSTLKKFQEGTKSIDEVRASIAALPNSIPENKKKELLDLLNKSFPDGMSKTKDAADKFASLNKALDLTNAQASNIRLQEIRESLNNQTQAIDDQLNNLTKLGQGNSDTARTLRSLKLELEASKASFDSFTQAVTVTADPILKLQNQLKGFDDELKKINSKLEAKEKELVASRVEAQKKGAASQRQIEQDKYNASISTLEKQISETTSRLQKAQIAYDKLTPKEKERATEELQKINEMRGQAADYRIKLAESTIQNEDRLRRNSIEDLDVAQKKAIDTASESEKIRLNQLQKLQNDDLISREELEERKTTVNSERIKKELAAESEKYAALQKQSKLADPQKEAERQSQLRASRLKVQELTGQSLEGERKQYETHVTTLNSLVEDAEEQRQIELQKRRNQNRVFEADAAAEDAAAEVKILEQKLLNETKDSDKREKIELDLLRARKKSRDADIQSQLAANQRAGIIETTRLQKQNNQGLVSSEALAVKRAELNVRQIEKEISFYELGTEKRIELEQKLTEAQGQLQDANIAQLKAKQEVTNQKYLNQIEEQNQAIRKQSSLYDMLSQALEYRNKLLAASKDLAKATSDFLLSELDIISGAEKSEYRKRQIAEITAAIKLKALKQEQVFERESLKMAQEQNRLAIEREKIANKIKQGEQLANIAQTQADIEILKADPKKIKSESGQAQLKALQLKLDAQGFAFQQTKIEEDFINRKGAIQGELDAADERKLRLQQNSAENKARFDLASSLPPGFREQAQRALAEDIMKQTFGANSREEFFDSGLSMSRSTAAANLRTSQSVGLSAYDPDLEYFASTLGGDAYSQVAGQTAYNVQKQFGNTANFNGVSFLPGDTPQLKLPESFGGMNLPTAGGNSIDSMIRSLQNAKSGDINMAPVFNITMPSSSQPDKKLGDTTLTELKKVVNQARDIARSKFN